MSGCDGTDTTSPGRAPPFGGRLQHVAQQFRLAQRFAAAVSEYQIGKRGPCYAFPVRLERRNRVTPERNRSHRFRYRRTEAETGVGRETVNWYDAAREGNAERL